MNKWKVAFFSLVGVLLLAVIAVVFLATAPVEQRTIEQLENNVEGNVVTVQTTAKEFEAIAKQYLAEAVENSPVPLDLQVDDNMYLNSILTVFNIEIPIRMAFDPIVLDGNIVLKQTSVNVGKLNIPPQTVLKLLNDSIDFPSWVIVQPNDAEIYVDLSRINIASGSRVRAKEIDLPNDKIVLELVIPTN